MVKGEPVEVTPFSATVTVAVPAVAISVADTGAVNWVALTKVVLRAVPFHCTIAPETKPVPLTVSVKPAWPAVAVLGLREVMAGPGTMVKGRLFDVTSLSRTFTVAVPAVARRAAGTWAVNCVALPNVVVRDVVPEVLVHCTVAPETKPVPVTVIAKAEAPAVAVSGLSEVIAGAGAMVKVAGLDVAPLSDTVTRAVPGEAIRLAATVALS
jgi:hypothetical protein